MDQLSISIIPERMEGRIVQCTKREQLMFRGRKVAANCNLFPLNLNIKILSIYVNQPNGSTRQLLGVSQLENWYEVLVSWYDLSSN